MLKYIPMIAKFSNISLLYPASTNCLNVLGSQQVRWNRRHRKPAWKPRAPSKLYIITKQARLPVEEFDEHLRLHHNYKNNMRIIRNFLTQKVEETQIGGSVAAQLLTEEQEEHNQCLEMIRVENKRLAILREERMAKEYEELVLRAERLKSEAAEAAALRRTDGLKRIDQLESLVQTFVTEDKVEEAILKAMDNPVDFNYSIDLEGRIYKGRKTLPHLVDKETLPKFENISDDLTSNF